MSKKIKSYNLKKTNSAALAEKSLLAGYGSASLYLDKLMDIYLSDNGFLIELSDESAVLLKGLIDKHERTAGFLLEKMIRKFCGGEEAAPVTQVAVVKKETVKRFVPPTWKEVAHYMFDKKRDHMDEEANKFCDFYESNGWKVGKNKMKCWKAAVRNWLKGNNNGSTKGTGQKLSANERVKARNDAKYRSGANECGLGMGANDGHMGRTVDAGEGRATIEHVDNGTFVDYE